MKKYIGNIAVDSGQIIIVDPCYVLDGKTPKENAILYLKTSTMTVEKKYGEITFSGKAGNGVVSTTFDGDGLYPVFAEVDKNGKPKKIIIELANETKYKNWLPKIKRGNSKIIKNK